MPHPLIILAIIIIVLSWLITVISNANAKRRRMNALKASFGKPPVPEEYYQFESAGLYAQYVETHKPSEQRVDSITWNDLDMDKVFTRINVCQTSVGEEYLYNCLHELPLNSDALASREGLIRFFADNPDTRMAVQTLLGTRLGKEDYNGLTSLMFAPKLSMIKYPHLYTALAMLPLAMATILIASIPIGVVGILAAFVINMFVHFHNKRRIAVGIPSIKYLTNLLRCCKGLIKLKDLQAQPVMDEIRRNYKTLKAIRRKVPNMTSMVGDLVDSVFEYINIMFLYDIRSYNKFMGFITKYGEDFHALYRAVGEIDISICILSFRLSLPVYSLPEFDEVSDYEKFLSSIGGQSVLASDTSARAGISFTDIFHPLIPEPVTNSGAVSNSSIITGSNASGKSTFIKALAINGILAQTINTCAAKSFKARHSLIVTSMVMRDDLSHGESYFIVEIKSLKRILDLVQKYPCTCYIDEILRGTNTIERIAASASVLAYLHEQNALCVAASHDIELTRILSDKYDNFHFREQVMDDGIVFDYKLKNGPSTTRNAIKLLGFMGFADSIVEEAEKLADLCG